MAFQQIEVHCPRCGRLFKSTVYEAIGGHVMVQLQCPVCPAKWKDSMRCADFKEAEERLKGLAPSTYEFEIDEDTTVTWTVHLKNDRKRRVTGVVIARVQPLHSVRQVYGKAIPRSNRSHFESDVSLFARYLVMVKRNGKRGQSLLPGFYAPRASVVEFEANGRPVDEASEA